MVTTTEDSPDEITSFKLDMLPDSSSFVLIPLVVSLFLFTSLDKAVDCAVEDFSTFN